MLSLLVAAALGAAPVPCIVAPADSATAVQGAAYCTDAVLAKELETIPPPGVTIGTMGAGTASATLAPWVESNGWRFLRKPGGKYLCEPPKGKAALAAAEAFAFGVDARLRIAAEDFNPLGKMLAFLKSIPGAGGMKPAANIAVIDTDSKTIPEVINLMVRRNLLCRVVRASDPSADLNVLIGSPEFPEAEAADPVAVAAKARKMLTDGKRLLRIYGTDVVIGQLNVGDGRARIHLLNYGSSSIVGIRVRIRGAYEDIRLSAFGFEGAKPQEVAAPGDATEFTIPEMGSYAIVDLKRREGK